MSGETAVREPSEIKTRFAPSPTGYLHLGNVWIAFLNWWWTRQHGGKILLRVEDIDRQRCRAGYVSAMEEDLLWLGFDWDEGPETTAAGESAFQSLRGAFYDKILDAWKASGDLYPCYCTRARIRSIASAPHEGEAAPVYDGHCRFLSEADRAKETKTPSWRIRLDDETVSFTDFFCGKQEKTLCAGRDDFVVRRADGMYAYQLAASADDAAMGVTHVFRGNDLLESTFDQIYLLWKLGAHVPVYAHLPLLTDENGVRLSKRQHGITVRELAATGKKPEDIIGKLLFWAGAMEKEIPVAAEEALRNIDFADCRNLSRKHIQAVF